MTAREPNIGLASPPVQELAPAAPPSVRFDRTVLLLGLLHAACRFVPLPLADEWLQVAVLKRLVRRALRDVGRGYSVDHVRPLYDPGGGCLQGCLGLLPKLILGVVLFPIRKILSLLGAVRGVTRDLTTALLLSRSVDRCLSAGRLSDSPREVLEQEAMVIRAAFDLAIRNTDLHLTTGALRAVLGSSKGLLLAAVRAARAVLRRDEQDPEQAIPEAERPTVVAGTERLESALAVPEIQAEILAFDRRFDEALSSAEVGQPKR
jgi:hypothetical protein